MHACMDKSHFWAVSCCGSCGSFLVDSFYEEIILIDKTAELD